MLNNLKKECIISLPITLQKHITTGLVVTPFVVSVLAKLTGLTSICCMNLVGMKYADLSKEKVGSRCRKFQHTLNMSGINIDDYWFDDDINYTSSVQEYCEELASKGLLQVKNTPTYICKCGAVELTLDELEGYMFEKKVVSVKNKKASCSLCNSYLEEVCGDKLFIRFPSHKNDNLLETLPSAYSQEINELRKSLQNSILVSRRHRGKITINLFGNEWKLDTDFCWSFLFCSLLAKNKIVRAVVISNRSLKQVVWSWLISSNVCQLLVRPIIIVTPFVVFPKTQSQFGFSSNDFRNLLNRYGKLSALALIAGSIKWRHKNVSVNRGELFWILKSLENLPQKFMYENIDLNPICLKDAVEEMDGNKICDFISQLRKEQICQMTKYQKFLFTE